MNTDISNLVKCYHTFRDKTEALRKNAQKLRAMGLETTNQLGEAKAKAEAAQEAYQAAIGGDGEDAARPAVMEAEGKVQSLEEERKRMGRFGPTRVSRPLDANPTFVVTKRDRGTFNRKTPPAIAHEELKSLDVNPEALAVLRRSFTLLQASGTIDVPDWSAFLERAIPFKPEDITQTLAKYDLD